MRPSRPFLHFGWPVVLAVVLPLALLVAFRGSGQALAQERGGSAERAEVDVKLSQTGVTAGDTVKAAVVIDIEDGWHANAHEPTLDYLIGTEVSLESTTDFELLETRYPEPETFSFSFAGNKELAVYSGRAPIFLTLRANAALTPGRYGLGGTLRIQICNDEVCLPPSTLSVAVPIEVVENEASVQPANQTLFAGSDAPSLIETAPEKETAAVAPEENQVAAVFDERGILLAFLGIFAIGLALNLTPCVYPMMSVTVSLFGTREEGRLGRSFGRAVVYVLGIATMYSVLGTVAAVTGGLFGAALQSPWVLGSIGLLLLAMAVSMFGAFELQLPASLRARLSRAERMPGLLGLYLSGLVVGVFAAPCIGPPTVALLAFVGSQGDPLFGFWAFTVMGLGLGAPYLVLGTFSGLLDRLPKSGVWMVWLKKLFGVVMVGAALFYLGLAIVPQHAVYTVPITLVGGGVYLGFLERSGSSRKLFTRLKWAVGAAAIIVGVMGFQFLQKPSMEWQSYSEEALTEAQAAGKPVLMNFHADWCIPCLELDHVTFTDEDVIQATEDFARVKVDLTRYDSPEARAIRKRFDVAGVPTLVFLDEDGEEIENTRVVGFMGPEEFLEQAEMAKKDLQEKSGLAGRSK